ncbi:Polycomb group protein Pc [Trichinella zimbabwensis]|uniref:Polycomb group protein Pc n=1 Tax=Trichinella zimbabwensis TaxID=268475 RepID=A0A0V1H5N0_9BILA|nr:Polycomb group protein Pc [Trichinella zimbabwensis]
MPRSPLNGNDVYAAEKIVASRVRNGELQYRIRWKDFSSYYDTWEPATNILDNRLITFFEAGHKPNTTTVKRRRRRGPFLGLKRRRLNVYAPQVKSTPTTSKSQPVEQVDSDLKLIVDQADDSAEENNAVLDDTDEESIAVLDGTDDESTAVLDSTAEDEEVHSVEVIKELEEEEQSVKEEEEKQDAEEKQIVEEKQSLEAEEEVNESQLVIVSEEKQNEECSAEGSYEHSVSPLPPALSPQLPDSGPSTSSDGDYLPPTTRTLTVITDRLFYFSSVKLTEVVHNGVTFSFAEF